MRKNLKELFNGDLTDLLNLSIIIYSCTYILSILSCVYPYIPKWGTEEFHASEFLLSITDCIVPTTATLVISSVIQNIALLSQYKIKRFALTIWAMLAVFVYMMLYPAFRNSMTLCGHIFIWLVSAAIVILGMYAIAQVENSTVSQRSISGK